MSSTASPPQLNGTKSPFAIAATDGFSFPKIGSSGHGIDEEDLAVAVQA